MTRYFQCHMKAVDSPKQTVGWIEERGAKLGAHVELKEFGGFFEVLSVHGPAFESDALRQKQANDRNCFGSLVGV